MTPIESQSKPLGYEQLAWQGGQQTLETLKDPENPGFSLPLENPEIITHP